MKKALMTAAAVFFVGFSASVFAQETGAVTPAASATGVDCPFGDAASKETCVTNGDDQMAAWATEISQALTAYRKAKVVTGDEQDTYLGYETKSMELRKKYRAWKESLGGVEGAFKKSLASLDSRFSRVKSSVDQWRTIAYK